jgi:hypothetical protein
MKGLNTTVSYFGYEVSREELNACGVPTDITYTVLVTASVTPAHKGCTHCPAQPETIELYAKVLNVTSTEYGERDTQYIVRCTPPGEDLLLTTTEEAQMIEHFNTIRNGTIPEHEEWLYEETIGE